MKLNNKSRILIPDFIRKRKIIEKGKCYYLIYKTYNDIFLSDNSAGKVIGEMTIDNNWRCVIPKSIVDFFKATEVLVYYEDCQEGCRVGIIFRNEST